MTDRRFAVEFSLSHSFAEPGVIAPLVEELRRTAIDLGFLQVSEIVILNDDADILTSVYGARFLTPDSALTLPFAVCYFSCALPDDGPVEIGVEQLPTEYDFDGDVLPTGLPNWWKCGAVRTRELRMLSKLLYHAAEIGFESSLAFGGMALDYRRVGGKVEVQQTWGTVPATD